MADDDSDKVLSPCSWCSVLAETKCSRCKVTYYCSRACQKKAWRTHKDVCGKEGEGTMDDDEERFTEVVDTSEMEVKVEVRESERHGKGVFATRDIKRGEKICFFDGELKNARIKITMSRSGGSGKGSVDGSESSSSTLQIKNAEEVFQSICESLETVDRCLALDKQRIRLGYPEPRSEFGIGQFINDSDMPEIQTYGLRFGPAVEALKRYQEQSSSRTNSEVGTQGWFQATKDVSVGSEILTHYGFGFWLQKFMLEANDPTQRFLYYALQDQTTKPFDLRKFYDYDDGTCEAFLRVLIRVPEVERPKDIIYSMTEKIEIEAP